MGSFVGTEIASYLMKENSSGLNDRRSFPFICSYIDAACWRALSNLFSTQSHLVRIFPREICHEIPYQSIGLNLLHPSASTRSNLIRTIQWAPYTVSADPYSSDLQLTQSRSLAVLTPEWSKYTLYFILISKSPVPIITQKLLPVLFWKAFIDDTWI